MSDTAESKWTSTSPFGGSGADPTSASVRGFSLEVVEGEAAGLRWESAGQTCAIGSHPSCDLILADLTVSKFHCEISLGDGGVRVRDLGSRNGTILDGTRVIEAFVKGGSLLRLGRSVVRFHFLGRAISLRLSERDRLGELVGKSVAMRAAFAVLERAAASDATTLLEGETGTGKSAAARSIHATSSRASGPFIVLDCGAIPGNLLESELFGHERGAFTGAVASRAGAFEEAGGGTVFLDEIGELPPELQPKLLGVLEDRNYRRVGSSKQRTMKARIICATNRDLRAEVNAGRFREDLYFRLAVITLTLPPLRRRSEDLPELARDLMKRMNASDESLETLLTPELLALLKRAAWPGNVRELRNYLEQCLVFEEVLPIAPMSAEADDEAISVDASLPLSEAKQQALAQFERAYLVELLRMHDGKVARAAGAAGIDRTYFYKLLRRHGVKK